MKSDNWGDLFWHLSKHTQEGNTLIVFDEISWMGGKDPQFLGQLKTAWDMYFSKNSQLIMALQRFPLKLNGLLHSDQFSH